MMRRMIVTYARKTRYYLIVPRTVMDTKNTTVVENYVPSKNHVKVVMRHVWEEYMEMAEDIRHTLGNKAIYELRKETIERIFGTAKEQHGFRYTQYIGKARMEMKAGLTFACMNLKKLARILGNRASKTSEILSFLRFLIEESLYVEKWCWE